MPNALLELRCLTPEWEEETAPTRWLSDAERARAASFVFPEDARRWAVFRAKARRILGEHAEGGIPEWQEGPAGKPFVAVPGLDFNLSHSDRLAVLLISRCGAVGIDLEPLDRAPELIECEDSFCHPVELERLPADPAPRSRELLGLWTAKEALLKAVGTGLGFPPTRMRIEGSRAIGGPDACDGFHLLRPAWPGATTHCLAIAAPCHVDDVKVP